jgi:hypothetical protein
VAIVSASNLVLGPCDFYMAPFGSSEPADSAITPSPGPPGGAWNDLGGTDGGVTFEVDLTYTDLTADQVTMSLGARNTETKMQVTAKLAEVTLNNLNVAINQLGIMSSGSGYSTMEIPVGVTATQPTYIALIIDGWAPELVNGAAARRRIIVRKVLSQVKASLIYDKKTQNSYDCTFMTYFISNTVNPIHIVDQTSL